MPLQLIEPLPQVYSTYQRSLLDFLGPHPPEVQVYHLPVGSLGLAELAAGATLADIVSSGCRFLASWPDGTCTSCEMTDPTIYGNAEFRNFTTDHFAVSAIARIAEARDLKKVQSGHYELHFLSIPGIYLEALHLLSTEKGSDLVLPVVSPDPEFSADAVSDAAKFLAIARARAAARIRMTNSDPLSS
jgi:hypothetical protein